MSAASLVFDIFAKDNNTEGVFKGISNHAQGVTKGVGGIASAVAAAGVVEFGKKAVDAFEDMAKSAMNTSKITGMSVEDASKLNFQWRETGVSAETGASAMEKLAKGIVSSENATVKLDAASGKQLHTINEQIAAIEHKGVKTDAEKVRLADLKTKQEELTASMGEQAGALGKLGISFTDANGKLLPMSDLLPKIHDKFAAMPAGPEKTAAAMQLFGKQAGPEMLKWLSLNAAGVEDLNKAAEDGFVVSQKDAEDAKQLAKDKRELNAAIDSVQVTIGKALVPVMTELSKIVKENVVPVIKAAAEFFAHLDPNTKAVAVGIGLVVAAIAVLSPAFAALNAIMAMNPISLVVIAIAALVAGVIWAYNNVGWFKDGVDAAFKFIRIGIDAVVTWVRDTAVPWFINAWQHVADFVKGFVDGLVNAWNWYWDTTKTIFTKIGDFIGSVWNGIKDGVTKAVDFVVSIFDGRFQSRVQDALSGIGKWLLTAGGDLVQGLIDGAKGMIDKATQAIKDVGGAMLDGVKSFLGIHSPSTEGHAIGQFFVQGIVNGLDASHGHVTGAMGRLSDLMTTAFDGASASLAVGPNGGSSSAFTTAPAFPSSLRLVVDGHEFTAYVDSRASNAIDNASYRAGTRPSR
ncbi:phage tail tape measure protein [Sinomonas sp. P47F7]|uniref:phage tail tape measure protein n=1 Tax=Sinomonas sp. P47F7 TaxID=3410987 RepID=UPI003BF5C73F